MAVSRTEGRAASAGGGGASAESSSDTSIPLVGRVRDRLNQELNARKERASEVIEGLAGTVRRIGEPLHDESLQALGAYADDAAAGLERLASGIRNREVSELADDLRDVARRRPATYAAAGFAAGFVIARFLRTTAAEDRRPARGRMAPDRERAVRGSAATGQPRNASAGGAAGRPAISGAATGPRGGERSR
jgi:hypothetical protein